MIDFRDQNILGDDLLQIDVGVPVTQIINSSKTAYLLPLQDSYTLTIRAIQDIDVTISEIRCGDNDDGEETTAFDNAETVALTTDVGYRCTFEVEDSLVGFSVQATPISCNEESKEEQKEDRTESCEYFFTIDRSELEVNDDDSDDEEVVVEDYRKYAVTNETREINGHIVSRIVALRDFGNVHAGEYGGYVESEDNLSHLGNCWIYNEAAVMDSARIYDDSTVRDEAVVCDYAIVTDRAKVLNRALVCEDAAITDNSMVCDSACVTGSSYISDTAKILHNALVRDADVSGHACIQNDACVLDGTIRGHAYVMGSTLIDQPIILGGYSRLDNRTMIVEDTSPLGTIHVRLEGITTPSDGIVFTKVPNENHYEVTVYADEPILIQPRATDPRSRVRVLYLGGDTFEEAVEIPDYRTETVTWPAAFIGKTDNFAVVVENDHYPDVKGIYTIDVSIIERSGEEEPVEDNDDPTEDNNGNNSLLLGVRTMPECISHEEEGALVFDVPCDTPVTIIPLLHENVTEPIKIFFAGDFDISDDPTLTYPADCVGTTDEVLIQIPIPDNEDEVLTYSILLHVVDSKVVAD